MPMPEASVTGTTADANCRNSTRVRCVTRRSGGSSAPTRRTTAGASSAKPIATQIDAGPAVLAV